MRRISSLGSFVLVSLLLGGCARHVSIPVWQRDVQSYVERVGDGNPLVLRDVTLRGDRPGFAVFSSERPENSTDANGLLLGHQMIDGRPHFLYLVGLVKRERTRDIRLAALSVHEGDYRWHLSERDSQAVEKYREFNLRQFRQRFPQRRRPPPEYTTFPRDSDRFFLAVEGNRVTAVHEPSGARWELVLSQTQLAAR